MLEVRNLTKVYKPKKGVPVTAINQVNLKFPDKGMVFLLGKSGSGKSTLLNLLGGLDKYDSGEILIKGVSSKDFKQKHFDSYRNTYLGFIFQEYNVLEEFNVGANIALALQLQGKKATDEEINRILKEVDLDGFGMRKPNELSGGQKQRVAIARALVKNPEIIMGDEPTGALDSNTGRQVLDTLKKLSKEKLVIVVSHDREFAEKYADRIIELADGRVISDMEYFDQEGVEDERDMSCDLVFSEEEVVIPEAYHLTEDDRLAINQWLDQRKGGILRMHRGEKSKMFGRTSTPTDESKIISTVDQNFKLIKSKLPMNRAFKIGASSLKHKTFRLVITILLSCIAFGLFGLSDTFGSYNHAKTCTSSIVDSKIDYAAFEKQNKISELGIDVWVSGGKLTKDDLSEIKKNTKVDVTGVFAPVGWDGDLADQCNGMELYSESGESIYGSCLEGLCEVDAKSLQKMNMKLLAGRLPKGNQDEILISSYLLETFKKAGYKMASMEGQAYEKIQTADDMLGRTITYGDKDFMVVGVVDTGFDLKRYEDLLGDETRDSGAGAIIDYALYNELSIAQTNSMILMAMVGPGYIDSLQGDLPDVSEVVAGNLYYSNDYEGFWGYVEYMTTLEKLGTENIVWLDGEKTTFDETTDVILSEGILREFFNQKTEYKYEGDESEEAKAAFDEFLSNSLPELHKEYYLQSSAVTMSTDNSGYHIVGYIPTEVLDVNYLAIVSKTEYEELSGGTSGIYKLAVGAMPKTEKEIYKMIKYAYNEDQSVRYNINNPATYELDSLDVAFKVLSKIFFYIGIGFAIFASIMLANFISTSISYKKQEIGILRAIGARGSDVFRIFFSESFIIAMINFVLASCGTAFATFAINRAFRKNVGLLVTVLNFGPRQVVLLFVVSIVVAALASFFPVWKIARKRPIDAIRNR